MRKAILVTGGAGYIGSHTSKALAEAGFIPVCYDNLSAGSRDFVRWGPFVEGDIRDSELVANICRANSIEAAIHFAGLSSVAESLRKPNEYYEINVAGALSLLKGLRDANVNRIIFSSTCSVYGAPSKQPICEEAETAPINPYGDSKLIVERILASYGRAFDLKWTALRYFNACGADFDLDIGEFRKDETHLIPRALMWIQGHISDFKIYGNNFNTPDGTAIRDYIHVWDLAHAHVTALSKMLYGEVTGVFNVGSGIGYSVKQVLTTIERVTGFSLPSIATERRYGDAPVLIADARRAAIILDFVPKHSDIDTIVQSAWAWHRKAHPSRRANSMI